MTADQLDGACRLILSAAGVPPDDAGDVAQHLVSAELRGHSSHGVSRLETYVRRLDAQLIRATAKPSIVCERSAAVLLDGNSGLGHVVGKRAMEAAIERARTNGIAAAGVRNSSHFGMAGMFALQAVEAGMIGIVTTNAAARMPPIGAKTPVLGTNPLAVAAPTRGEFPILLDMATSVAALGKVNEARDRGAVLAEGQALAQDGTPTTDPAAAIAGMLLPMAGPKGFGLAFALEILSAVLTGASVGRQAGSMYNTWDRPEGLGHFFVAISIEAFGATSTFLDRMQQLVDQMRAAEPIRAGDRVYLPGELEFIREKHAREHGIELSAAQAAMLERLTANATDSRDRGPSGPGPAAATVLTRE